MDMIDEPIRPIEFDRLLPSDQNPQQTIKSDEMIDMRVRHEDVFEALNLPRRQVGDIAEIKQDRAPLKERFDIKGRVSGSSVDQAGMEDRPHEGF